MLTCTLGGLDKIKVSKSPRMQDESKKEAHHGGCVPFLLVTTWAAGEEVGSSVQCFL
jgi:hypothetical protein